MKSTATRTLSILVVGVLILWILTPKVAALTTAPAVSVGYEKAVRESDGNLITSAGGYTSLTPQIFFEGRTTAKSISRMVTSDLETDLQKANALAKWVHMHVRPQTSGPNTIVQDDFYNILRRGWGYCDQMAHVYATLAHYAGIPSRQLQLFRDGYGSPHTLAESLIDGRWVIVATWRGFVPLNLSGKPMTKEELASSSAMSYFEGLQPNDFINAKPFYSYPYAPTGTTLNRAWHRLQSSFVNLWRKLQFKTDLSEPAKDQINSSPNSLEDVKQKGKSVNDIEAFNEELIILDKARRAHLRNDYQSAINGYEKLRHSQNSILRNQAEFWTVVAYFDLQDYEIVDTLFFNHEELTELNKGSSDAFEKSWLRIKAESLLSRGKLHDAKLLLIKLDTPQARADLLRLFPNNPVSKS